MQKDHDDSGVVVDCEDEAFTVACSEYRLVQF